MGDVFNGAEHVPVYTIVVCGDGAVGKSAMTIQLTQKTFVATYDPTIENAYRQSMTVDGSLHILDILDTAGQEEYSAMRDHYYRKGHGFLIVFSVLDKISFMDVDRIAQSIFRVKDSTETPIVVAGNKIDMEGQRTVTRQEAEDFVNRTGLVYIETSARTGYNIDEAFSKLVQLIDARQKRLHAAQAAATAGSSGASTTDANASTSEDEEIRRRRNKHCVLL